MSQAFRFSSMPLDVAALTLELRDDACGGFATFEGWVRNHNEGLAVTRLEYEAFTELAQKEGDRIVAEAVERFGVARARCAHRLGSLAIGDIAVWVGVSAAHRDEAFRACRYVIDEVKHRVPIWKKETYVNGDSGWVNCERCATHAHEDPHPLTIAPDYSRQQALREVGAAGQARLRAASVLVVGAGGLGVPVLQYLAGAGVGSIGIVDGDVLEPSNLHRQTWYALADCGRSKAELAAARVRALNPDVRVEPHMVRLDAANAEALARASDLVLDCTDNFATKFLLNDLALRARKPVLFASVYQFEGQLQWVTGDDASACLRCVWPEARDGLIGNCAEAGVLGPVPGALGSLQALEALRFLLGIPALGAGEVLLFDLVTFTTQRIRARRAAECAAHAGKTAPPTERSRLEVRFATLADAEAQGYTLIDVRDSLERESSPIPASSSLHLPISRLLAEAASLDAGARYLLVCATGRRSNAAAELLRSQGFAECRSLQGGLAALGPRT